MLAGRHHGVGGSSGLSSFHACSFQGNSVTTNLVCSNIVYYRIQVLTVKAAVKLRSADGVRNWPMLSTVVDTGHADFLCRTPPRRAEEVVQMLQSAAPRRSKLCQLPNQMITGKPYSA